MPRKKIKDSPELAVYKAEVEHSVNTLLTPWTLLLKANNVVRVEVQYSGGGDSGQIDAIVAHKQDGTEVEIEKIILKPPGHGSCAFEDFIQALMDHRGWSYNDDGGCGGMTWDLEADMFTHTDTAYYTESTSTEYKGLDGVDVSEYLPT